MKIYGLGTENLRGCIMPSIDSVDENHQPLFIFVNSWLPKSPEVFVSFQGQGRCISASFCDAFGLKMLNLYMTARKTNCSTSVYVK